MFKIYDIVKVKDNLVGGRTYNGLFFPHFIEDSCGKEYRIIDKRLRDDGEEMIYVLDYINKYGECEWVFNESMLELKDEYDNNILLTEIITDNGRL